jgi:hypothetical protein
LILAKGYDHDAAELRDPRSGIDITIFNPKLDATGAIGGAFVDALAKGLVGGAA